MDNLSKRIEAVLFVHGDPMTISQIAKILDQDKTKIRLAAEELDQRLIETALVLVWKNETLQLATRPALAKDVKVLVKEEVSSEISRAAFETLAVIVYRGPVTRAEIDYIRGVNSSYTLRNLLMRGLIERSPNPKDARTFIYQASIDFLKHLGISKLGELPEYTDFNRRFGEHLSSETKEK